MPGSFDEAACVNAIRSGDARAYEQLFRQYCQALINFGRRLVSDTPVAENIVQDVFLDVWENRARLDPQLNIRAYLYRAVRNRSLNHLRHLKVRMSAEPDLEAAASRPETPEDVRSAHEAGELIQKAISDLPEKCRNIFTMNRFDQLTYAQIADVLDISVKTVETQMGRALIFLRKRLQDFL